MSLSAPVAGLEIGTSRTVIAIGEARDDGRIEVTALGSIPSTGVRKSQIIEMTQTRYSIESVLKKLDDQFGYTIGHACLAVSGPQVRTTFMSNQWQLERGFVHDDDIAEINARAEETNLPPERTQLELHPISYGLDENSDIASPKGMHGNLLKLRSLCIHGSTQRINDARAAAAKAAKLEISQLCFAGTCAANAVLTPQDRREGTLVIDLGGGTTTFTAWASGHLVYAGVLGVGGDHVTNDIHTAFGISRDQAEQIKATAASALVAAEDGSIRVPVPSPMPGFKAASISRRALNTVVNARMQELFTIIRTKLDDENLLHLLNGGVVLTGGGAALANVVRLAQSVFGCSARLGTIIPDVMGVEKVTNVPPFACATIAGLLLRASAVESKPSFMDSFTGIFKGVFRK